ncbi:hypothetical protein EVAR_52693_1 [Eumeta japonica]|uniref:DUF5641 domain-containing protein n=1 Tax=Eumeta variegata TaxID=151549 RepID=A0A4C1XZG8_EUMVA|nr:hypothetical protein EVAR_52693_1 [Eumeta japonica]
MGPSPQALRAHRLHRALPQVVRSRNGLYWEAFAANKGKGEEYLNSDVSNSWFKWTQQVVRNIWKRFCSVIAESQNSRYKEAAVAEIPRLGDLVLIKHDNVPDYALSKLLIAKKQKDPIRLNSIVAPTHAAPGATGARSTPRPALDITSVSKEG